MSKLHIKINGNGQTISVQFPVIIDGQSVVFEKQYSAETITEAISVLENELTARSYDETVFIFDDTLCGDGKYSERIIKTSVNRINKIASGLGVELGGMENWNNQGTIWNHTYTIPILI